MDSLTRATQSPILIHSSVVDSGPGQPFDSPPRTGTSLAHRCKNFRFRGVTATLLAVIWACLTLPTESVPQLTFLTWPAPTIVNKPLYIHALVNL